MKSTVQPKKELNIIHSLRGIASFSVCLYHLGYTTIGFLHIPWILGALSYGRYGVHIFFVISGFVIPFSLLKSEYNLSKFHRFILKRFVRIEPPYLAAIIIGLVYVYVREFIPGTVPIDIKPNTKDVLLHFGYLVPFFNGAKWLNDVFWTLAIEFQYYLIIGISFPALVHSNKYFRWTMYFTYFIISYYLPYYQFFPYWSPVFMIGLSYTLFYFTKISLYELLILQVFSLIYIALFIDVTCFVLALSTIVVIIVIPNYKIIIFHYLGRISYSLYLIHCFSGVIFVNLLSHYSQRYFEKALVLTGGILISIMAAHIMYKLIENPTKIFSSKIKI